MTILRPRSPHLSMASTSMFLVTIWVTSVMVAIPTLLYSTTVSYGEDMVLSRTACIMVSFLHKTTKRNNVDLSQLCQAKTKLFFFLTLDLSHKRFQKHLVVGPLEVPEQFSVVGG